MKRMFVALMLVLTMAVSALAAHDYYRVKVTRIDDDIYRTDDNPPFIIVTEYCYRYAYSEGAILKYDPNRDEGRGGIPGYGDFANKLIFDSGASCRVITVK